MSNDKNPYGKVSEVFAVGRIRAVEETLLSPSDFGVLIQAADVPSALRSLIEMGYGSGKRETGDNISPDALINNELSKTSKMIREISPDNELTDLFFLEIDAHNLKVYLKSKLTGEDPQPLILGGGTITTEVLRICAETDDYSLVNDAFCKDLEGLGESSDPGFISTQVDKALFAHIFAVLKKHGDKLLKDYFTKRAMLINSNTRLRAERLGYSQRQTDRLLIDIPGVDNEVMPSNISFDEAERSMNRELLNILRDQKGEPFSIAPVVCFLMDKRNEALNLRILFAAKQSGIAIDLKDLDL